MQSSYNMFKSLKWLCSQYWGKHVESIFALIACIAMSPFFPSCAQCFCITTAEFHLLSCASCLSTSNISHHIHVGLGQNEGSSTGFGNFWGTFIQEKGISGLLVPVWIFQKTTVVPWVYNEQQKASRKQAFNWREIKQPECRLLDWWAAKMEGGWAATTSRHSC